MKFSIKWLREHLSFDQDYSNLLDTLNKLGLEVENIINPFDQLKDFRVVEILEVNKHPNADKLTLCQVSDGKKKLQIVCGAKNVKKGLKSVLAPVGTFLPKNKTDEPIQIKKSNIRGEESFGMLCSEKELCLSEESEGIIELDKSSQVGQTFSNYLDEEQVIIEIAITPNRVDCAGVSGIARDIAASGFGTLKNINVVNQNFEFESDIKIHNELKNKSCPQFYGRIIKNVTNNDSPDWMVKRFKFTDIKIISALVDITNYTTMNNCRPLHVFDLDKIKGNLKIRHSKKGEQFVGLDGVNYNLDDGMIVICDDNGIISLAGILGGLSTACDKNTKNIFVESAFFDPNSIANTGRKLNIISEARYRFERGIDPLSTIQGLNFATEMIIKHCGGEVGSIVYDGPENSKETNIEIDMHNINQILGTELKKNFVIEKLSGLGCKISLKNEKLHVIPPSWRSDLKLKEDLIEEVARMYGYENIIDQPMSMREISKGSTTSLSQILKKKIARLLVSRNFMELITWSFVDKKWEENIDPNKKKILINNPISEELGCLRSSLYTNILLAIKKNENRGMKNLRFFEIGPIFYGSEPGDQDLIVSGIITGYKYSKDWLENERNVDLYDVKSHVMSILDYVGLFEHKLRIIQEKKMYLHPKKNGAIYLGNTEIGSFGIIHPSINTIFDIKSNMCGFEINLSSLLKFIKVKSKSRPGLKKNIFQSSIRDFSFIIDKDILASKILESVRKSNKEIIKSVNIFDCYEGRELGDNKKAIALEVVLQSDNKTLSEKDIDKVTEIIISNMSKFCGGKLR